MRSILLAACLLLAAASTLSAQDREDPYEDRRSRLGLTHTTFRVALVPGLSTNGLEADRVASRYSWNILAGYNGALEGGFELGGLLNINRYYAHGVQLAGLANLSGRETAGVQLAGLLNYSARDMQGLQFAGLMNIGLDDLQGLQFAGLGNWSGGYAQGLQFSGVLNYAGSMQGLFFAGVGNYGGEEMQGIMSSGVFNAAADMQGLMFSGVLNLSEYMQGIALSTINISKEFQGIQAGVANLVEEGQGIQVGVVNVGRHFEGVPVGLISFYENGRHNVDVWTGDGGFTNVGLKLGTEEVYNMISVGYNPLLDGDVWQVGWSIGYEREYRNYFTYGDFSWFHVNEGGWTEDLNSIFKYRWLFGTGLGEGIRLYGGPTFNLMVSRTSGSADYTWYDLYRFGAKGRDYTFWIGYALGIELF